MCRGLAHIFLLVLVAVVTIDLSRPGVLRPLKTNKAKRAYVHGYQWKRSSSNVDVYVRSVRVRPPPQGCCVDVCDGAVCDAVHASGQAGAIPRCHRPRHHNVTLR